MGDMDQLPVPDQIKKFIWLFIPSVSYLEALLMVRSDARKWWDYKEIAPRLYLDDAITQQLLEDLRAAGALNANEQDTTLYRYEPRTPELQTLIDQLAALYAHNLVGVTHLIHSKLNKKAQQFADAFKWQKDT